MAITLQDLMDRFREETDEFDTNYISDEELKRIINSAIAKAGRIIMRSYEDYFLAEVDVAYSAGGQYIDYPSDILINKIRYIVFIDAPIGQRGGIAINIKRERRLESIAGRLGTYQTTNNYPTGYYPVDGANGRKMKLTMPADTSGHFKIGYIRSVAKLEDPFDVLDIPEFEDTIIQIAKVKYLKNDGDPRYAVEKSEEEETINDMVSSVKDMTIADDDSKLQCDYTFYQESF